MHLGDLIDIGEEDANEFIKLVKEEQSKNQTPIDIVDIKKKSHLKIWTKKLYNTVFGSMSGLTTLIITIIIGILLYRFCVKRKKPSSAKSNDGIAFYQIPSGAAEVHTPNQNIQKAEEEPVNENKLNIKAILSKWSQKL